MIADDLLAVKYEGNDSLVNIYKMDQNQELCHNSSIYGDAFLEVRGTGPKCYIQESTGKTVAWHPDEDDVLFIPTRYLKISELLLNLDFAFRKLKASVILKNQTFCVSILIINLIYKYKLQHFLEKKFFDNFQNGRFKEFQIFDSFWL